MKSLTDENDLMKQQLKDFPQLQLELNFYKNEYERQKVELREAYMNLNKQQLADSEQFKQRLDSLHQERNELESQLLQANNKLQQVAELESKESERTGEISRLNGQLEAREREISALHSQTQALQTAVGEKQVLESQLEQLKTQLKEANQTITNLQAKQKSTFMLEVDRFDESETKDETKSGKRNGKVTVAK
jgi:chromosome segregation ATPase